jgi:hypothetical protein
VDPPISGYGINFIEAGLPFGTQWGSELKVDNVWLYANTTLSTISWVVKDTGVYDYKILIPHGYNATPKSGTATVSTVNSVNDTTIHFYADPIETYSIKFTSSLTGYSWSVKLSNSTSSSTLSSSTNLITFTKPDGKYAYIITAPSSYKAIPSSGNITVSNSNITVSIAMDPLSTTMKYTLTFYEEGLPIGTLWSVQLVVLTNQSTSNSIAFTVQNGTYNYTINPVNNYACNVSSGQITIHGSNKNVYLDYNKVPDSIYQIEFIETGLPIGTSWSITMIAMGYDVPLTLSTTSDYLDFEQANGTYDWNVSTVSGYHCGTPSGSVQVNGRDVSQAITYYTGAQAVYIITFTETGLNVSTVWGVEVNGTLQWSSSTVIIFYLPNATYNYEVENVSGYTITSNIMEEFQVFGASVYNAVVYKLNTTNTTSNGTGGLGSLTQIWNEIVNFVKHNETTCIIIAVIIVILIVAGRKPREVEVVSQ